MAENIPAVVLRLHVGDASVLLAAIQKLEPKVGRGESQRFPIGSYEHRLENVIDGLRRAMLAWPREPVELPAASPPSNQKSETT